MHYALIAGLTVFSLLFGWDYARHENKTPKDFPAYCIDPFLSEETDGIQYSHCSNVPMWSLKV